MPRSPANNTFIPLLRKLSQKLGEQQAKAEMRWMAEHVRKTMAETQHHRIERRAESHMGARLWRDQPAMSSDEIERDSMRLGPVQWAWLRQAVSDRVDLHKPLQYIIGDQPFGNAKIGIRPPVLIPRWETEEWVLRLTNLINEHYDASRTDQQLPDHMKILDACTGSGCIALGLACELPANSTSVTGVDISTDAIALARDNLELNTHSLKNSVKFHRTDLQSPEALSDLRAMEAQWHMIVSNPPYVTVAEYEQLAPDVKDWEDVRALVPMPAGVQKTHDIPNKELDPDGVSFCVQLARTAKELGLSSVHSDGLLAVTSIPRLVIEIGGTKQVEPVRQAMHDNGFNLTEVWKDMAGTDRVVLGYAKE
ncbi:hypothetical protein H4R24_000294 [Coemansia sp. RSA 988]|nr:hypothetical protein H4R24_000294 [Coemansia sp. RSA 988]